MDIEEWADPFVVEFTSTSFIINKQDPAINNLSGFRYNINKRVEKSTIC